MKWKCPTDNHLRTVMKIFFNYGDFFPFFFSVPTTVECCDTHPPTHTHTHTHTRTQAAVCSSVSLHLLPGTVHTDTWSRFSRRFWSHLTRPLLYLRSEFGETWSVLRTGFRNSKVLKGARDTWHEIRIFFVVAIYPAVLNSPLSYLRLLTEI